MGHEDYAAFENGAAILNLHGANIGRLVGVEGLMVVKVFDRYADQVDVLMGGLTLGKVMVGQRAEQWQQQGRQEGQGRYGKEDLGA